MARGGGGKTPRQEVLDLATLQAKIALLEKNNADLETKNSKLEEEKAAQKAIIESMGVGKTVSTKEIPEDVKRLVSRKLFVNFQVETPVFYDPS